MTVAATVIRTGRKRSNGCASGSMMMAVFPSIHILKRAGKAFSRSVMCTAISLIAVAWAEGIQAAIHAFKEITSPYWLNEKRLRDNKIALMEEKITQAAKSKVARR